jgi:hypothetical protein
MRTSFIEGLSLRLPFEPNLPPMPRLPPPIPPTSAPRPFLPLSMPTPRTMPPVAHSEDVAYGVVQDTADVVDGAQTVVAATVCVQAVTSTKAQNFAIVLSVLDVSDDCAAVRDCTQGTAGQGVVSTKRANDVETAARREFL